MVVSCSVICLFLFTCFILLLTFSIWLVGWSVGRSVGWWVGWAVGWLVGRSVGRSVGWLVGRSVGWSVGRSSFGWLASLCFKFIIKNGDTIIDGSTTLTLCVNSCFLFQTFQQW